MTDLKYVEPSQTAKVRTLTMYALYRRYSNEVHGCKWQDFNGQQPDLDEFRKWVQAASLRSAKSDIHTQARDQMDALQSCFTDLFGTENPFEIATGILGIMLTPSNQTPADDGQSEDGQPETGEFIFALDRVVKVRTPNGRHKFFCSISATMIHELMEKQLVRPAGPALLDQRRVNDIAQRIITNTWHGGTLTWNCRPDEVETQYDEANQRLYILQGVPTVPDSYQRHEAIKKAVARVLSVNGLLNFNPDEYAIPLIIEQLEKHEETQLTNEYNRAGNRSTGKTKQHDVNQLSRYTNQMVNRIMETSKDSKAHLFSISNVELMADNITKSSPKMVTFRTLSKGIKLGFPQLDEDNFEAIAEFLQEFQASLGEALPDLKPSTGEHRRRVRKESIVDSNLMIQAYLRLAGHLWNNWTPDWENQVAMLGQPYDDSPNGHLMSRKNPLWQQQKVTAQGINGDIVMLKGPSNSNGALEALKQIIGTPAQTPST